MLAIEYCFRKYNAEILLLYTCICHCHHKHVHRRMLVVDVSSMSTDEWLLTASIL